MSFKDLKAKRDGQRVTTVTAPPARSSETQLQLQDPLQVSSTHDDLPAAWALYKNLPPNVKIQETVERGRGLWATEPISAGQWIENDPHARVYSTGHYRDNNHQREATRLHAVDPVPLLALFELHRRSDNEMQPVSNCPLLFDQVSSHN
jgi:hypothetical protein